MDYSERLFFAEHLYKEYSIYEIFNIPIAKKESVEISMQHLNRLILNKGIYSRFSTLAINVNILLVSLGEFVLDKQLIRLDKMIMDFDILLNELNIEKFETLASNWGPESELGKQFSSTWDDAFGHMLSYADKTLISRLERLRSKHIYSPARHIHFNFKRTKTAPFNYRNGVTDTSLYSEDVYLVQLYLYIKRSSVQTFNICTEIQNTIFEDMDTGFSKCVEFINKMIDFTTNEEMRRMMIINFYVNSNLEEYNPVRLWTNDLIEVVLYLTHCLVALITNTELEIKQNLWNYVWTRLINLNFSSVISKLFAIQDVSNHTVYKLHDSNVLYKRIISPNFNITDETFPFSIRDGTGWYATIEDMCIAFSSNKIQFDYELYCFIARQNPRFFNYMISLLDIDINIEYYNFAFPN